MGGSITSSCTRKKANTQNNLLIPSQGTTPLKSFPAIHFNGISEENTEVSKVQKECNLERETEKKVIDLKSEVAKEIYKQQSLKDPPKADPTSKVPVVSDLSVRASAGPPPKRNQTLTDTSTDNYFSKEDTIYYENLLSIEKEELSKIEQSKEKQKWVPLKGEDKVLGKGSFGTVVIGNNKNTGEIVAVKLIEISKEDRKEKCKLIKEEVTILKEMRHNNIVRYFGILQHKENQQIGIVCEFVSGGSLWSLVQKFGKFNENLIRKYTHDILLGLEYLHYHGIIHRDIKGANILVDPDGLCKLADFGLAKSIISVEKKEVVTAPQGTPNWMAPEVCRQGFSNSRFSDIWSLGCTILEMINGAPPYQSSLPETIILKVGLLKNTPELPEGISESLKDFLLKCFQINANDRWNVRQLLNHPFLKEVPVDKGIRSKNNSIKSFQKSPSLRKKQDSISSVQEQTPLPPPPLIITTQKKNWKDSLRTIIEESNPQTSNLLEDTTEVNLRFKSPSFFMKEAHSMLAEQTYCISANNQSSNILNINFVPINGIPQSTGTTGDFFKYMLSSQEENKMKSIKLRQVNSNIILNEEETSEKQKNEDGESRQNSGTNKNEKNQKIVEEAEGEDDEDELKIKYQMQNQEVELEADDLSKSFHDIKIPTEKFLDENIKLQW